MRRPPRWRRRLHHNAKRAALLASLLVACASPEDSEALREALALEANALAAALAEGPPPAPGPLRVRLAFGAGADLDLYVTDPAQETVYFANTPTKVGGELAADLRCGAPVPRIETVAFAAPPPGRYRVGVDYPESCTDSRAPVAFVIYLEAAGQREQRRGSIRPREFLPIVLEVDVE